MMINWLAGLQAVLTQYEGKYSEINLNWCHIGDQAFIKAGNDTIVLVIKNFNIDFLYRKDQGDTIMHILVRNRRLPSLIALFSIVKERFEGGGSFKNQVLNNLT